MADRKLRQFLNRGRILHYDPDKPPLDKIGIEINKQGYRIVDPSYLPFKGARGNREPISRFSRRSKRSLVRLCANNCEVFKYFVTLTYHDVVQDGSRVKMHLNRFLTMLRKLGAKEYIWALEFQKRGSIHLHLWLGEHQLESYWREDMCVLRANLAKTLEDERNRKQAMVLQHLWLKSSEQLEDKLARKAAVDYQLLRAAHAVKIYAIKYGSKLVQKRLPEGVKSIGRWWGASRKVANERLFAGIGHTKVYDLLMGFCEQFGFPKLGSVVAECDQAEVAWKFFLETIMNTGESNELDRSRANE
jgi:hypothetical protein